MSYRKVSDGGDIFDHSGTMGAPEESEPIPPTPPPTPEFSLPVTFIFCPNCMSDDLVTCSCYPANYQCKCGWYYVTHDPQKCSHPQSKGDYTRSDYGGNVSNNSLITGTVRK